MKLGGRCIDGIKRELREEMECRYDQGTLFTCVKFSKNKTSTFKVISFNVFKVNT